MNLDLCDVETIISSISRETSVLSRATRNGPSMATEPIFNSPYEVSWQYTTLKPQHSISCTAEGLYLKSEKLSVSSRFMVRYKNRMS